MKRVKVNALVLYDGELFHVTGIADGRTIHMEPFGDDAHGADCPYCGNPRRVALLEDSPLFQQKVEPVRTVEGS